MFIESDSSNDDNLGLLLGVQNWRYCAYCMPILYENFQTAQNTVNGEETKELEAMENLYAKNWGMTEMVLEMAMDDGE